MRLVPSMSVTVNLTTAPGWLTPYGLGEGNLGVLGHHAGHTPLRLGRERKEGG